MYKKIIMVVLMACLMPLAAAAQSASKFYNDGMAQYNKRKYSEAITLFKKSIAIDGSNDKEVQPEAEFIEAQVNV